MTIDNGIAHGAFADEINTAAPYIDMVKFGWGTALVTPDIERKFEVLRDLGIGYYFGGTLFEKFVRQDRFESFHDPVPPVRLPLRGGLKRNGADVQPGQGRLHPQVFRSSSPCSARWDSRTPAARPS